MKTVKNTGRKLIQCKGLFYFSFFFLQVSMILSCTRSGTTEQNYFHYNETTGISSLDPVAHCSFSCKKLGYKC
jgi:hypothetical protein